MRSRPGLFQQFGDEFRLRLVRLGGRGGGIEDPPAVARLDLGNAGRRAHGRRQLRQCEHALGRAAPVFGNDEHADALAAGAAGPAGTMQQGLRVARHVGVDHEVEVRKVDAARRDIGRHADMRASVAHGLQRVRPLRLRHLARKRNHREAAIGEARREMANRFARVAEHQGARAVGIQQRVDDGVFALVAPHQHQLVFDVGMLFGGRGRLDTHRIRLHGPGQFGDAAPHGRRKQQRPALLRRRAEDEFQVVAKTEVQHLVGFVEHHRANGAQVQRAPRDVVAQAPGRADDEMGATFERTAFVAHVHAAHAGRDPDLRRRVEPFEFPLDLDGKFARRSDDQAQRRGGRVEAFAASKQRRRDGDAEGDRLSRAGLRRDQQIGFAMILIRHRQLNRRQLAVAFRRQGGGEGRMYGGDRGCAVRVGTQRHGHYL